MLPLVDTTTKYAMQPFKDFASVTVYHPKNLGHDFANVGFIGWIGALTGQSSAHMAISEIGVTFPDATFGKESRVGIPFVFLLRDILQFDTSYLVRLGESYCGGHDC